MNKIKLTLIGFVIVLSSCASNFDPIAYSNALKAKENTLELISKGDELYSKHESKIDSLRSDYASYIAYEKTRKYNTSTIEIWRILQSDNGSVFRYFKAWKENGLLSSIVNLEEVQKQITRQFDDLIELELKKK